MYTKNTTAVLKFSLFSDFIPAGDKIEKNEMGRACGAYGRGEGGV